MVIKPVKGNIEDLISEVKDGALVKWTWDMPNICTGDLSASIGVGYKIKNGEIVHPIKEAAMGINMMGFMKNIIAIGSDIRPTYYGISPSILVDKVRITGAL